MEVDKIKALNSKLSSFIEEVNVENFFIVDEEIIEIIKNIQTIKLIDKTELKVSLVKDVLKNINILLEKMHKIKTEFVNQQMASQIETNQIKEYYK